MDCINHENKKKKNMKYTTVLYKTIIGASLSEPHTSRTALRKCVCNILVCLRPYTLILYVRLNISQKLNILVHLVVGEGQCCATYCQIECSIGNHNGDSSNLSTHGTVLLVCHSSYGTTINSRLLTDHTNSYTVGLG